MRRILARHWFLLSLLILIPGGFLAGSHLPEESIDQFNAIFGKAMSRGLTAAVLFLMSVTLNTGRLAAALRAPKPVIWATIVNCGAMPLLAWPLVRFQSVPDFALGLMIISSVPSTMAAASVWTRSAGGNDAISLLVTMLTNGLCFVVTPFWMGLVSDTELDLSASTMVLPLLVGGFIPIAFGQLARFIPKVAPFVDAHKLGLSNTAQVCLLGQVVWACVIAGPPMREGIALGDGWDQVGIVWSCCILLHVAGLVIAWFGSPVLNIDRENQIAVAFAGSQKTLPIAILIATTPQMLGGVKLPFAIFPILMFHASQLIIDTVVATRIRAIPASDGPADAT